MRGSIEPEEQNPIDRLANARPRHYNRQELAEFRGWLHNLMSKWGEEPNCHPPDDLLVAQFLSITHPERLRKLLYDLMALSPRPHIHSYGWFRRVAMQQIHGISPQEQRHTRANLREAKREAVKPAPPEQQPLVAREPDEVQEPVDDLRAAIRAAAAGKGMR